MFWCAVPVVLNECRGGVFLLHRILSLMLDLVLPNSLELMKSGSGGFGGEGMSNLRDTWM